MIHKIVFDENVEIDHGEIISQWNTTLDISRLGTLRYDSVSFDKHSDSITNEVALVLVSVATGVTANVLYDCLKSLLSRIKGGISGSEPSSDIDYEIKITKKKL